MPASLKDPTVRLFLRALATSALVAVSLLPTDAFNGGQVAWHSLAVGAALAFCEVFTPLNGLVGLFKQEDIPRG